MSFIPATCPATWDLKRMDADEQQLAALVGNVAAFASTHLGCTPLLRPSGRDHRELLDVDGIERLLSTSARRPTFRLVRDGVTLPPERSTAPVRLGGARLDDVADLDRIATAVGEGATLVLQGLQRTWPPLIDLCRALERATSHPVQANAYLTPSGAAGLARHTDEHDVLVLQVVGSKAWKIDELGAVVTTAGDVLYLPAGTAHAAEAQDEPSLHITLGILRVTVGDAVARAIERADVAALRAPLPLGYARRSGAGELEAVLEAGFAAAGSVLASGGLGAAAHERERALTRRVPLPTGRLGSVLAADRIDGATIVVLRPHLRARLADGAAADGRLVIDLDGRRMLVPAVARPALDVLLSGDPVVVGSLPDLDDGSRVVLARRLVREGVLVVETS
jgi:lysine-specific demethylase/histidyl-hydroxylase NO66